MNLIFRMFLTIFFANRASRLEPLDMAHKPMRVLPNDLDVQMHMNNGRFLSIMDLGRLDLMVRLGFWGIARQRGWYPLVGSVKTDYRRPLTVFQKYDMTTQIVGWDDRWVFIEQQFLSGGKLCARALFKTMIRSKQGLVTPQEVMGVTGFEFEQPLLSDEMKSLL
jgi:acyl-CoA thioesterase FadM